MITDNINVDKVVHDIGQQLEVLIAIANDNPILTEQVHILHEVRDVITAQSHEIERLDLVIENDDQLPDGIHVFEPGADDTSR